MDPNRFNAEVRPYLVEIPIGKQGVAFDRIDLDAWFDEYKDRNGRPGKRKGGNKPWDKKIPRAHRKGAKYGTSRKSIGGRKICESTGKSDLKEAEGYLAKRIEQSGNAEIYGIRPKRTFRQAATKYLNEAEKATLAKDAWA